MAFLVAVCLIACGDVPEPAAGRHSPLELISGFWSYQSIGETKNRLGPAVRWSVLDDTPVPARGSCPRFDTFRLAVPNWGHLGEPGELWLDFVNDALYSVSFFPDRPDQYLELLKRAGTELERLPRTSELGAFVAFLASPVTSRFAFSARTWKATAYTGRVYIGWEDPRIREEMHAWIASCS